MTAARSLWLAALLACGGPAHPARTFDAKQLAADLDRAMADLAAAAAGAGDDCPRLVMDLGGVLQRTRGTVEAARRAQQDPEQAQQLTAALHTYDKVAAGRADAIAMRLAICYREHRELQDRIKALVDSMPTL